MVCPILTIHVVPAGFFVCKLKKLSNDLKVAEEEEEEDDVPEDSSYKAHVLEDKAPQLGKRKKKFKKEIEINPDSSEKEEEENVETKPKKKRIRGIVKKAMAELEAERQAKQTPSAKKEKKVKSKKSRK